MILKEERLTLSTINICLNLSIFSGCMLQRKGTRDGLLECRNMLQRSVDIRTERLGVYHEDTIKARKLLVQFG